jgi:hypothetical protein
MQASMQTSRAATFAPPRSRVRRSVVRTCAAAAPVTWGNRSCHKGAHLSKERKAELEKVCEHIAQRGKGITACDEGPGKCPRRAERTPAAVAAGWIACPLLDGAIAASSGPRGHEAMQAARAAVAPRAGRACAAGAAHGQTHAPELSAATCGAPGD